VANRLGVRRIGEVCTNSLNSATVSSHADQELIKSSARAAVTISHQRQMLLQSLLSDGEHFRVIEIWFIIVWKFFFIGLSFPGLIESSLRGRDKPSYCQVFGCLSAIFGSTETDENENGLISVPTCEEEFRYLGIQALIKMGVPYEPGRQSGRS
ncbi:MAG TPA: hypothetical protein VNO14_05975, partial [Blastocatellia bacterium]|nr:hypothetical protein [Blastocatellia bacterium]